MLKLEPNCSGGGRCEGFSLLIVFQAPQVFQDHHRSIIFSSAELAALWLSWLRFLRLDRAAARLILGSLCFFLPCRGPNFAALPDDDCCLSCPF